MARNPMTSVVNLPVVKRLLMSISIPQETADRFGVSPAQLETWLHSLAGQLDALSPAFAAGEDYATPSCRATLTAEELRFLLNG